MTQKLFWEDPYQTTCTATITRIDGNMVTLDRTIFYAFSGGQVSDQGTIHGIPVLEARKEGDTILYTLEDASSLSEGMPVTIAIDWNHRYELMRLHAAQHIVAYFLEREMPSAACVGGNIRPGKATLTYELSENITSVIPNICAMVNTFITHHYPIKTQPENNNAQRRIWTCNTITYPCGGTHVKNTSEIGTLNLKRKSGGKNKEMIEITLTQCHKA